MDNNHKELLGVINNRFDKLEEKLDQYSVQTVKNTTDTGWIKGYLKTATAVIVSVVGSIIGWLLSLHK